MVRKGSDHLAIGGSATPRGLSRAELEAAKWLVRLTSGDAGDAEQARFRAWCGHKAANRAACKAAHRLWLVLGPVLGARGRTVRRSIRPTRPL